MVLIGEDADVLEASGTKVQHHGWRLGESTGVGALNGNPDFPKSDSSCFQTSIVGHKSFEDGFWTPNLAQ